MANANIVMDTRVMSTVASGVAARYGVKVTVSGTGAYSTVTPVAKGGRTVYVPEINIPSEIRKPTPEALVLMRGYLDHEAAHVRWSDWDVVARAAGDGFLKHALNIVEDVRVERLMSSTFAGAKQNLHDIAVLLFGGSRWREQIPPYSKNESFRRGAMLALSWLLYRMRSIDVPELESGLEVLSDVLDAVRPNTRPAMENALGRWMKRNGWPSSTEDAMSLAEELAKAFRRLGAETGVNEQDSARAAADVLEKAGLDPASAGILGEEAAHDARRSGKAAAALNGPKSADLSAMAERLPGLGTLGHAVSGMLDGIDPMQHARHDVWVHGRAAFLPQEEAVREEMLAQWRPDRLAEALNLCSGLGARLRSLLQTQSRVMQGTGRSGRRLDGSVLWRAGARDGRVFRSSSQRQDVNASVLLLVDVSGSMCGAREHLAAAATVSILSALDQVKGVDSGACVYTADSEGGLLHSVIRMPGDRTPASMLLRPASSDGTNTAGSMLHCASLLPHDSPRRIMLVISDGDDSPVGIGYAERELREKGISVVGVNVGSGRGLRQGLSVCRDAARPEDIPAAAFGALQEVLLGSPS